MKQLSLDKYSIAWFKLADCVSRGEKERAFGVYRLLSHSFEDQAFSAQLMGDLLLSFDDEQALQQYEVAAQRYVEQERFENAIGVYEHLVLLKPDNLLYRQQLVEVYVMAGMLESSEEQVRILLRGYLAQNEFDKAQNLLDLLSQQSSSSKLVARFIAALRYDFVICLLQQKNPDTHRILEQGTSLLVDRSESDSGPLADTALLNQFLAQVRAVDEGCYKALCSLIK